MSSFGHPRDRWILRSFRIELPAGETIETHRHGWHQLVYASRGAMEVETPDGTWLVPSRRAVWVPAGAAHSIVMLGRTLVETVYLAQWWCEASPERCVAIDVNDLLRALIVEAARTGMLDERDAAHARLAGVILDQVRQARHLQLQIPMPVDDRALAVARAILDAPGEKAALSTLARRAATSERTLARIFVDETGMTPARWRAQARFVHAVRHLAAGAPIGDVAGDAGYDSTSAFISAFKRLFGTTPGRYLNG